MLYVLLLLATVISDQWLKYWIVNHLELGESMPFIPHILQLERLHNYGAAFSSLTGKTAFLLGMTVVLLLVLAVLLARRVVRHPLGVIACVLILGGGIGNMIDRIALGYVVVGAILGSIYYLWLYEKYDAPKKESADGTEDPAGHN